MFGMIIQRLMRFLFFHLYHSFAWAYDLIAKIVSNGDWFRWGNTLSDFVKSNHIVLEVGFGTGHFQKNLHQKGMNIFGIDESSAMIKNANKTLYDVHHKKIARADVYNLPFVSANFDRIISIFPSDYIFQKKVLNEIHRNLKPGGKLIVLLGVIFTGKSIIDLVYRTVYFLSGQKMNEDLGQRIIDHGCFFEYKKASITTKMLNARKLVILILEK